MARETLKERWYRRRFLVPNAVTLANMFCGFLAIVYASNGRYEKAALAIGIAILLDGLDGRVARKLNATSPFGVEFDSFSDLISFGLAPAILIYFWAFASGANEFGVIVTFPYCVAAATRLARFNISPPNLKSFVGLPTPGAAALAAAVVNFAPTVNSSPPVHLCSTVLMIGLAGLMISRLEFFSVKEVKIRSLRRFARISIAVLIGLTWYSSGVGFLLIAGGYSLSGPFLWIRKRYSKKPAAAVA